MATEFSFMKENLTFSSVGKENELQSLNGSAPTPSQFRANSLDVLQAIEKGDCEKYR